MILGRTALPSPGPVPKEPIADVPWLVWARVAEAAVLMILMLESVTQRGWWGGEGHRVVIRAWIFLSFLHTPHPHWSCQADMVSAALSSSIVSLPPSEALGPVHSCLLGRGSPGPLAWGPCSAAPCWYAVGVTEWKLIGQGSLGPPSLHQGTQFTWGSGSPEQGGLGQSSEGGQSRGRFWRGWRVWSASS